MSRGAWIAVLAAVMVALQPAFLYFGRVMKRTGGVGIVGMEKLGSWEKADPVLAGWSADDGAGLRAARRSVWLDFLFIPAYAVLGYLVAVSLSEHAAAERFWPGWSRLALSARVLFPFAGLLDVVENVYLLMMLSGKRDRSAPSQAASFASSKFMLFGLGSLLLLTVAIAFLGP